MQVRRWTVVAAGAVVVLTTVALTLLWSHAPVAVAIEVAEPAGPAHSRPGGGGGWGGGNPAHPSVPFHDGAMVTKPEAVDAVAVPRAQLALLCQPWCKADEEEQRQPPPERPPCNQTVPAPPTPPSPPSPSHVESSQTSVGSSGSSDAVSACNCTCPEVTSTVCPPSPTSPQPPAEPPSTPPPPPPPPPPPAQPRPSPGDVYSQVMGELHWVTSMMPEGAEGGSFVYSISTHTLFRMALSLKPGSVYCESGFNGGHSAVTVLAANPDVTVYSIDLLSHPYSKTISDAVALKYGPRFQLIGRSVFDELLAPHVLAHKCDFIFADSHVKNATASLFDVEAEMWIPHAARKSVLMFEGGIQYVSPHPHQFKGPGRIFGPLVDQQKLVPLRFIQSTLPSVLKFPAPTGMAIWLYSVGAEQFSDSEIALMAY